MIAASLDAAEQGLIARGGGVVTRGIPRFTWNGLDHAGRLFPGVHPAAAGEVQLRFAWNDRRALLFEHMRSTLADLRTSHPQLRHVVGGGSYFGPKPHPGDVDLALLALEPDIFAARALNRRNPTVHVYPAEASLGGAPPQSFVHFFRFDRGRTERGLVLLDVDELLSPV